MTFPRKVMTTKELEEECGLDPRFIRDMAHVPGQKCAFKRPGGRKFYFDTERLGKQMEKFAVR